MSDVTPGSGAPEPTQPIQPIRPADGLAPAADAPTTGAAAPAAPPAPPSEGRGSKRLAVIGGVTAAVLVVGGVGAFAAMRSLGGSDPAESALPAGTLASISIDLDPGAKQKVEAIKTVRKFPGLRKELDISSGDDLREKFFTEALKDCKGVTYAKDVEPWIGQNAALGAVAFGKSTVAPVLALAVTDQDGARAGVKKLNGCGNDDDRLAGIAFSGDFAVLSDTQAHADRAAKEADRKALADDASYEKWTAKVGDRGIVNFYLAKAGAAYLADNAGKLGLADRVNPFQFDERSPSTADSAADSAGDLSGGGASAPFASDGPDEQLKDALAKFEGGAGTVRFADSGVELSAVIGAGQKKAPTVGDLAGKLPSDSAAAVVIGYPQDTAKKLVESFESLGESLGVSTSLLEQQLGLSLPEDLQTVLGDGVAVSLADDPRDLESIGDPTDVPAGVTIKGDPTAIEGVLTKVEKGLGLSLADLGLSVEKGDGTLAASFDPSYAKALAKGGNLGSEKRFTEVVPEAKKSSSVLYADLDSGWLKTVAESLKSSEAKEFTDNTEPLKAFGASAWLEGGDSHLLVKLTTD